MHHDRMKRLVARALASGARRVSVTRTEWDVAGNCTSPVVRELHVRPADERDPDRVRLNAIFDEIRKVFGGGEIVSDSRDRDGRKTRNKYVRIDGKGQISLTLEMHLRCRKCDRCREKRRRMWSSRAKAETAASSRTWFGTLTLNPGAHAIMLARARVRLAKGGTDFDTLSYGEQFQERYKECSAEVTKYLKRVRKESGVTFRTLIVAEHHKSGLPHFHLLVHERYAGEVKHRTLSSQWQLGFEKWRVVSELREATYLCKYLAKATVARVRASGAYGTAEGHSESVKNDYPQTRLRGATEEANKHVMASSLPESSTRRV